MPPLSVITTALSTLPQATPPLVIVITGATSGIGSYTARAYASTYAAHGSKLRVYLVGRSVERAETLMRDCRQTSPGSEWRFIQTPDLALMSGVDAVCEEIGRLEEEKPFGEGGPRVDVLYMGQAISPLQPSGLTTEGIDTQMSLIYYSRIRFIQKLTRLLRASPRTARVISIFAGGVEEENKPGTLPIGTPDRSVYGVTQVRNHTCFMKTFLFEALAEQHAGKISFTHIYPGLVDGPTFYSDANPLWFRVLWRLLKPLLSLYMTSPEVCGQVMVFLATQRYPAKKALVSQDDTATDDVAYSSQRERGGGAYAVGQRGDEKKQVSYAKVRRDDTGKIVGEHTMGILEGVEKKNAGK
ncbi:short-chain dehydrogenase [Stemphylium lycopersici]|nr:short-chain dehydrogenase [Stemphylium lycopersici]